MRKIKIIISITIIFAIVIALLLLSEDNSLDNMKTKVTQDFQKYRDSFDIICKELSTKNFKEIDINNYAEYSSSDQEQKAYECIFDKLCYTSIIEYDENIVFEYSKGKWNLELEYSKNPEDYLKYYEVLDENWYYDIFMYE